MDILLQSPAELPTPVAPIPGSSVSSCSISPRARRLAEVADFLVRAATALLIFLAAWIIERIVRRLIDRSIKRLIENQHETISGEPDEPDTGDEDEALGRLEMLLELADSTSGTVGHSG